MAPSMALCRIRRAHVMPGAGARAHRRVGRAAQSLEREDRDPRWKISGTRQSTEGPEGRPRRLEEEEAGGWSYVTNASGEKGWAPRSYLYPIQDKKNSSQLKL